MRLRDRVVIVTGSTTGIGLAIARRCAAEGARVLIHGRDADRANAVARELKTAAVHIDDLSLAEAPQRIVQAAMDAFGRIDVLVNNAALCERDELSTLKAEAFDRLIHINTRAPMLLIQAALPYLADQHGCVLNIGSVNGYCGEAGLLSYSMSKGALMTLSRNLGDVLPRTHGVRVNHLNVGWVLTENERTRKSEDGLADDWFDRLPMGVAPAGRLMQPEEIATMALPWMCEDTHPVSGSVVDLEQYPMIGRNLPKETC